jgi:hypothetical protein
MVGETDRLGHLQVGEAGQDDLGVVFCDSHQGALQRIQQSQQAIDFVAQPQAHVGGDLVVAAAPRVQSLAGVAHQLGQSRFNVQMHVLQVQLPFKAASFDVLNNLGHPALDVGVVLRADDALGRQHLGVGQRAGDVGAPQALVKENAGGVALDQLAHGFGKERGPGLGFLIELVCRHALILRGAC